MLERPILIYKPTCPPCQWMSRLVCALSFGVVRRVPVEGVEAQALYDRYPDHRGELVLQDGGDAWFQRRVFLAIPLVVLRTGARAIGARLSALRAS
jgi:hypothetical protein